MSATNFYQTLYQTDQLFRLADESWGSVDKAADVAVLDDPEPLAAIFPTRTDAGFLTDLDQLASPQAVVTLVDEPVDTPALVLAEAEPEPTVVMATPEPLPQPAPRPTTPSILPPVQQQPRLPQLNHKVLLLADEELDPSNLLFLEKILKAVNLNVNGVDLLNLHGVQDMDFAELLRGKYINHFITFGVPFERINLDIMMDRYAPVRFEGITFLMADSLPTIEADQNLKKRLWSALQRVFLQRYA
jgi:DNA polymerase III psi subunit